MWNTFILKRWSPKVVTWYCTLLMSLWMAVGEAILPGLYTSKIFSLGTWKSYILGRSICYFLQAYFIQGWLTFRNRIKCKYYAHIKHGSMLSSNKIGHSLDSQEKMNISNVNFILLWQNFPIFFFVLRHFAVEICRNLDSLRLDREFFFQTV